MTNGRANAESFDEFVELFQRLRSDARVPGTAVLVEGVRDRRALRRLGLDGPIVVLHRGQTISRTAAHLVGGQRRVIVLTDWDTEGGHFAQRLKEFLTADRVTLDLEYRRRLARILRGELVHVEGLHGWARRLAEARGGSLEQFLGATDPD
jgi:5S rRNA maturation endonuclease (ribonuclease M5)